MSKSLKNFITIKVSFMPRTSPKLWLTCCLFQEFLKQNSAIAFRIFCLGVPFNSDVDFNPDRMKEAQNVLAKFNQFFSNIDTALRFISSTVPSEDYERKWSPIDLAFSQTIFAAESILRKYLEDNFNTVGALQIIGDVVREGNLYMGPALTRSARHSRNPSWPKGTLEHLESPLDQPMLPLPSLLQRASKFVAQSMSLFGVDFVNASSALQMREAKGDTEGSSSLSLP